MDSHSSVLASLAMSPDLIALETSVRLQTFLSLLFCAYFSLSLSVSLYLCLSVCLYLCLSLSLPLATDTPSPAIDPPLILL